MSLAHRRSDEIVDEGALPSVLESLDCLRVAITVFGADGRLIYANRHLNHLFRALPPLDEMIGQRYEDLLRLEIEGGDLAVPEMPGGPDAFIAYRKVQLFSGDYAPRDVHLSDGRVIETKVRRTVSGGWIALWADVTQVRRDFERLQNAIALSADAFAFYDRNDALMLCNTEYALVNGANSAQELIGSTFAAVAERLAKSIHASSHAEWLQRRIEAHGQPAGAMTVEIASGASYLLRDRATSDGGRVVVFTDVTEHRRAEKAFAEQTRALDDTRNALSNSKAETTRQARYLADLAIKLDQAAAQADTTKRTLLRTMSHELKTPLNAIIGFSDLLGTLADSAGPDQIREYAGLIHQGGKNLLRLINEILDLTKISAGRYELRRQTMDASFGLWHAKDDYGERAEAKNITIAVEPAELNLMIDMDETVYGVMLGHLVDNAVRFTQPGGTVRLSAERRGDRIAIAVADNGPGVRAEDIDRILEPFEQGGRATSDHEAGTGLGLTLVKAFSELLGGRLSVTSAPGEGFTATVELPAAR